VVKMKRKIDIFEKLKMKKTRRNIEIIEYTLHAVNNLKNLEGDEPIVITIEKDIIKIEKECISYIIL